MPAMPRSSASCFASSKVTGKSGVRETHRDAAAHGAGAHHRDACDLALRSLVVEARDLAGGALGEERMPQRLRLGAGHELA